MKHFQRPIITGTERLFNNNFLESLTRWHISIPVGLFFIYAAILLSINISQNSVAPVSSVLLFLSGWLVFTWVEYLIHRWLFHITIGTEIRRKFQYTMHGIHHRRPKDKSRIAMPPVLSLMIVTVLMFVLKFFIGDFVFAFLPGFLVGYACYLLIHYLVHIHKAPKNIFRHLWINHGIHHYKDDTIIFGVSSPFWDYVYGTLSVKEKSTSKL